MKGLSTWCEGQLFEPESLPPSLSPQSFHLSPFFCILNLMVLSNWLFDLIVFGVLLAATLLDAFVPALAARDSMLSGAATLLAVGAATYLAAQEISDALKRRSLWTQEAVATATALSVLGFLYFKRNDSDLALLALSIVLMMASLMLAIAFIACLGETIREGSFHPPLGLLATIGGATILGALAGFFTLSDSLPAKVTLLVIGFAVWKLRENMRPPERSAALLEMEKAAARNEQKAALRTLSGARRPDSSVAPAAEAVRRALIAQRGTLLDRLWPVLVLGALVLVITHKDSLWSSPTAAAAGTESTLPAGNR